MQDPVSLPGETTNMTCIIMDCPSIQTNPEGRESRWVVPLKEANSMLPLAFNGPFSGFLFPGADFFLSQSEY